MSISLDSLVGELQITAGARQSTTPATCVVTAPRRAARGRAEDTLYLLVDLPGASSGLLGDLMQTMLNTYWATPGSVTSALRAAITTGGEWLMDRNVNAPATDRHTGGLSCLVLRGSEVVVAQAGPASAYVAQHGVVHHYPLPDAEQGLPLGAARSTDVQFARVDLQPGDVIVLTDVRWAGRIPGEAVASAIVRVSVTQALINLTQLTGNEDLIAVVIEAAGAVDVAAPAERPAANPIGPAARPAPAAKPSTVAPESAPSAVKRPVTQPEPGKTPAPKVTPEPSAPRITPQRIVPKSDVARTQPKAERESFSVTAKAWLSALFQGARRGAGSVGAAGHMVVQRTLPESAAPRGRASSTASSRKPPARPLNVPLMAGIAIAIPVIVALIVATLYIQSSGKAELDTHLVSGQNAITLAGQRVGAEARVQWQLAIKEATEALLLDPDNALASEQLNQAQLGLDRLDNVVRLSPVELWNFKSAGPHRLAMQGFSLFVLDRGANEVDRITLNAAGDALEGDGPEKVLSAGTIIDRRPLGGLLDMTWINSSESRSTSSLVVALQGGLLEYNLAFGWKTLDFGSNTMPAGLRRVRSFNGNLYMLDAVAGQVWRYVPKGDGYSDKPEAYFDPVPPIAAKGSELLIDGSVYIITADGQIAKYLGGKPESFQISGLSSPLSPVLAAAVDVNQADSSLYVAVPGGLLQLRPDGKFVRQFRVMGTAFAAIEDLLIDEQNGRVFVISGGRLYTAALPPLQ